jgi:hypothetical protein
MEPNSDLLSALLSVVCQVIFTHIDMSIGVPVGGMAGKRTASPGSYRVNLLNFGFV